MASDSPEHIHLYLQVKQVDVHVHHTVSIDAALAAQFQSLKEAFATMATTVQAAIDELTADVAQQTSVDQSAITLINGIPALIASAVAAAQAAGATPAQLQAFTDLNAKIKSNSDGLVASVSQNTPAA